MLSCPARFSYVSITYNITLQNTCLTGSLVLKLQTRGGQIKQDKEKDEVNTDKPKAKDEQCGHHYW